MAKEIEVPNFLNYTDCRKKTEENPISEIERNSIKNYAEHLTPEGVAILLSVLPDEVLLIEIESRLVERKQVLKKIKEQLR